MSRRAFAGLAALVVMLGLVGLPASASGRAAPAAAAQVLTWTADSDITRYKSAPTTAVAGATTIVFENSVATGNTDNMIHTLTFDTSTPGYNHDVRVNITASPEDANGGKHQQDVVLTEGKYRYMCVIPGHGTMVGEFTVTGGGGDTTPPTVDATVTGQQDPNGNYIGSATVTVTADDGAGSGVDNIEYKLDSADWAAYTGPVNVNTAGAHMVHYRATDVAGNVSPEGMKSFTVVAGDDTTPPTVTAFVSGEQNPEGHYIGKATVTVNAEDTQSGVDTVEYELDDTGFQPYTAPVEVTAPGDHTVQYRATDVAGNVSETGSVPFRVVEGQQDTTPPTVSAVVSGEQDPDGNYLDSAMVTLTAEDAGGSGVKATEYKLDSGEWTAYTAPVDVNTAGAHMVHYRATDNAGNVSPEGMAEFTVVEQDTAAPTVSAAVAGEQDPDGNYVGTAVVTVSAEDAGSGVDTVEYQLDGGAWTAYTAPVEVRAPGAHTVNYRATDVAGNVSEVGTVSFAVVAAPGEDTTAPSVSATVTGNQNSSWQFVDSATINLSAFDSESGVKSIEFALDAGAWTVYTAPVKVDTAGKHTLKYRATDVAGNVAPEQSGTFTVVKSQADACASSDTRSTVFVGGADTGVANVDTGNGCTVSDVLDEDGTYADHGAFVRHVKRVTATLVEDGKLDSQDRNRLVRAANRSGT